jgi:hypothetical protein
LAKVFKQQILTALFLGGVFLAGLASPAQAQTSESSVKVDLEDVPALIEQLKQADADRSLGAIYRLSRSNQADQIPVPLLIDLLYGGDSFMTKAVVSVLSAQAGSRQLLVPRLLPLLQSRRVELRTAALQILGHAGSQHPGMALLLLPMLEDSNEAVRLAAVLALRQLNQSMAIVTPKLISHLQHDQSSQVRAFVVSALIRIEEPSKITAIPQLMLFLKNPNADTRYDVIMALGSMKKSAKIAIPELSALLQAPEPQIRSISAWAIGRIDDPNISTIMKIMPLLQDKKISVQRSAVEALERLGYQPSPRVYVEE